MPRKFKPRSPSELPPPPSNDELRFQTYQFDSRISGQTPTVRLGGTFFNSTTRDRSLKYDLSKSLKNAADILR